MAIVNITAENDADFIRGFVLQTNDAVPVAIDLTGNTLRMGVRKHAADVTEELLLTTENGGFAINDPTNGGFTLHITNEQLEQLQYTDYDHSLIRILPDGTRLRIWSGTLTVTPGASRQGMNA
jgi:hypothetical protein